MTDTPAASTPSSPTAPAVTTPPVAPSADAPAAVVRPEWLPEAHWDPAANTIKPEFGQHYSEVATFHKTQTEQQAALAARKPEEIKIEVKLPDTVKLPDGMQIKIDETDPRVPIVRELAIKHGLSQETVDAIVAIEAQQQIAAHTAEQTRIAAERTKLGPNAAAREAAAGNWLKGMKDRGELTAEEYAVGRDYTIDAAGLTFLEKIMAKAAGTVPGHQPAPPPPPPSKDHATRIWGENAFNPNPQAKAS